MIQSVNHLKIEFYLYPFTRFNHLNLLRISTFWLIEIPNYSSKTARLCVH